MTITSSPKGVWRMAGIIYGLGVFVSTVVLLMQALAKWGMPDGFYWCVCIGVPPAVSAVWLLHVWHTRKDSAREMSLLPDAIEILRHNGRRIRIDWSDVDSVEYCSVDDSELTFVYRRNRTKIYSHGFKDDQWRACYAHILERASEEAKLEDTHIEFESDLNRWLNKGALAMIVIGGGSTLGLLIWNYENAAAYIVPVGVCPVLIYLGMHASYDGEPKIPLAKAAGFYAQKVLAYIPIGVLVYMFHLMEEGKEPRYTFEWLYYTSNLMFFGAMASALIVAGGYSHRQYYRDGLKGINRYHGIVFKSLLAICAVGFALKWWNEP